MTQSKKTMLQSVTRSYTNTSKIAHVVKTVKREKINIVLEKEKYLFSSWRQLNIYILHWCL